MKLVKNDYYLLFIDEEAEIKVSDYWYNSRNNTFDRQLDFENTVEDIQGGQKRYYFKIIAYYPLTKEAKELDLPLLPNPFKKKEEYYNKDAIIKAFYTDSREWKNRLQDYIDVDFESWFEEKIKGNKEYIETNYFTLEDMKKVFFKGRESLNKALITNIEAEEIIQSLSTQRMPSEFIPEYDEIEVDKYVPKMTIDKLKTITNSEGKEVLIGTYKY